VMGVEIPVINGLRSAADATNLANISEPTARQAADETRLALEKLLKISEIETTVERLAAELMTTNRKVNALQNTVIPRLNRMIAIIEDSLDEENLEEFFKAKKMRSTIRSKEQ